MTPARPDLAAAHLRGSSRLPATSRAARCRSSRRARRCGARRRPTRRSTPRRCSAKRSTVYDEREGWAWAQLDRDGYVGYLPFIALGRADGADPSGRGAPHPRLSRALDQAPAVAWRCSLGARADDRATGGRLRRDPGRPLALGAPSGGRRIAREPDFVAVAERFLHAPYLWGGRTSEGIDCSGLVQAGSDGGRRRRAARQRHAGGGARRAPFLPARRSRAAISSSGRAMSASCATPRTLLHASGWHMAVVSEPLAEARARIAANGGGRGDERRGRLAPAVRPRVSDAATALLLAADPEIGEAAVELRQAAAAVEQLLRAAGPGRMGVRDRCRGAGSRRPRHRSSGS